VGYFVAARVSSTASPLSLAFAHSLDLGKYYVQVATGYGVGLDIRPFGEGARASEFEKGEQRDGDSRVLVERFGQGRVTARFAHRR
jgi:hypothetical protein